MSKFLNAKTFLSLGIALSMVPTLFGIKASAETVRNDIVIEGNAKGLVTIPDTKDFLVKDNFLPGDSAEGTIKLTNKYDYSYEVFLRADDIEKKSDESFAKQLKLNIDEDGQNVYNGELQGEDKMAKEISLGVINPGETRVLDAKVILDGITTTNEYQYKYASVQWIFTAERSVDEEKAPAPILKTLDNNYVKVAGLLILGAFTIFAVVGTKKGLFNIRRGKCEK